MKTNTKDKLANNFFLLIFVLSWLTNYIFNFIQTISNPEYLLPLATKQVYFISDILYEILQWNFYFQLRLTYIIWQSTHINFHHLYKCWIFYSTSYSTRRHCRDFQFKKCTNKLLAFDRSYMLLTYYMLDPQISLWAHWAFVSSHVNQSCNRITKFFVSNGRPPEGYF